MIAFQFLKVKTISIGKVNIKKFETLYSSCVYTQTYWAENLNNGSETWKQQQIMNGYYSYKLRRSNKINQIEKHKVV